MRSGARITYSSLCLILHGGALNLVPFVHLLQLESPLASSLLSVCLSASLLCCAPQRWESSGFGEERSLSGRRWLHPFLSGQWEAQGSLFLSSLPPENSLPPSSSCVQAAALQKLAKPSDIPLAWCEAHFPVVSMPGGLEGDEFWDGIAPALPALEA